MPLHHGSARLIVKWKVLSVSVGGELSSGFFGEAVGSAGGIDTLRLCGWLCSLPHMATNLAIDDRLIRDAQRIGGLKTKKETVTEALREFIQHRKQQQIIKLFGSVEWADDYDPKQQRNRR
jgi:Arc/MetJ family transcription regulator